MAGDYASIYRAKYIDARECIGGYMLHQHRVVMADDKQREQRLVQRGGNMRALRSRTCALRAVTSSASPS
ncbi:hypothetical protein AGR5A_Lc20190 [Agrobacterium genomosp. 5 str. CFBP 6626]|nr:hypothetical protein AGR5A_Lc20190 [Agrobacterium genomosp. 5 str. CFBP 6626]